MSSRRSLASVPVLLVLAMAAASQQPAPAQKPAAPPPVVDNDFLQKQFGNEFTLEPSFAPLIADFDGDGVEDIAIVAHAKNPLVDQAFHQYKAVDPYYEFWGVGDPKITSRFGTDDPQLKPLVLCVIHGAGPDAWRAATAKAKFVIIHVPFKQVAVKHILVKKKLVAAIFAEESGGVQESSLVYFDGKKYKYEPMGSSEE